MLIEEGAGMPDEETVPDWLVTIEYSADEYAMTVIRDDEFPYLSFTVEGGKICFRFRIAVEVVEDVATRQAEVVRMLNEEFGEGCFPISIRAWPADRLEGIPELVALADIAKMMGVSRQRAKQLADSRSRNFPRPFVRHETVGPLFELRAVQGWIRNRDLDLGRGLETRGDPRWWRATAPTSGDVPPSFLKEMYFDGTKVIQQNPTAGGRRGGRGPS